MIFGQGGHLPEPTPCLGSKGTRPGLSLWIFCAGNRTCSLLLGRAGSTQSIASSCDAAATPQQLPPAQTRYPLSATRHQVHLHTTKVMIRREKQSRSHFCAKNNVYFSIFCTYKLSQLHSATRASLAYSYRDMKKGFISREPLKENKSSQARFQAGPGAAHVS